MNTKNLKVLLVLLVFQIFLYGQKPYEAIQVKELVAKFKADPKGPYRDIRWFCKDGTTVGPQERCVEKGGVQRARYKDEVVQLAVKHHIYLGQILSTTDYSEFWDEGHQNSRFIQFQLESYLRAYDNGWVNRKAQYYRGAFQIEDEEEWGRKFFEWLLKDKKVLEQKFLIVRLAGKEIPHAKTTNTAMKVRALSKELADEYAAFMNLRIKIHGSPDEGDIKRVGDFLRANKSKLSEDQVTKFESLIEQMRTLYKPVSLEEFKTLVSTLSDHSLVKIALTEFTKGYSEIDVNDTKRKCEFMANHAYSLRLILLGDLTSLERLAGLDAGLKMESLLMLESSKWKPATLLELYDKTNMLARAAAAFGYLELWEYKELSKDFDLKNATDISMDGLKKLAWRSQKAVEWSTSSIAAQYHKEMMVFKTFEPIVEGFVDEKVRASILLQLGSSASYLGNFVAKNTGISHEVPAISNPSSIRGLNPGYAKGTLIVTKDIGDLEVNSNHIYVFSNPPADLKPVVGIATVSEGNLVSHVQLLARNLGIPNAVLSGENLEDLKKLNNTEVFYAVSPGGKVVLKNASEMTAIEKALFAVKKRSVDMITVPVDNIEIKSPRLLNLNAVNASHSGKMCGPKAANLGQLKKNFPEQVVEGIVIPFSVFKQHFDQLMPLREITYWEFLTQTFERSRQLSEEGKSDLEIESFILKQLSELRTAILAMPLIPEFVASLKQMFKEVLGEEFGDIPVFLRSDTNMEDLNDFTGAGLNLTLFNVRDSEKILTGIKEVWASPYSERSYKWRQRYLLNPENVFPSILIIPSVDVDASGVMITKGIQSENARAVTVAFNRGVGGAVEGQMSEMWEIEEGDKFQLIGPCREKTATTLPKIGGKGISQHELNSSILSPKELNAMAAMADQMRKTLPISGMQGPYDVELGFKNGKMWLFQVRPFVENKKALSSDYLNSLNPVIQEKMIPLSTTL
ncbi:MAG: phosphoenolpyruvate synthase [Flavobacteriales bacterium]|nr:phosphoenolpyruvate synthase [Flavobacteriales bacterium]